MEKEKSLEILKKCLSEVEDMSVEQTERLRKQILLEGSGIEESDFCTHFIPTGSIQNEVIIDNEIDISVKKGNLVSALGLDSGAA